MERETNEEFVVRLMTFARSGPLMHAFIFQALDKYSEAVVNAPPEAFASGVVHGPAWQACAAELQKELKERLACH